MNLCSVAFFLLASSVGHIDLCKKDSRQVSLQKLCSIFNNSCVVFYVLHPLLLPTMPPSYFICPGDYFLFPVMGCLGSLGWAVTEGLCIISNLGTCD